MLIFENKIRHELCNWYGGTLSNWERGEKFPRARARTQRTMNNKYPLTGRKSRGRRGCCDSVSTFCYEPYSCKNNFATHKSSKLNICLTCRSQSRSEHTIRISNRFLEPRRFPEDTPNSLWRLIQNHRWADDGIVWGNPFRWGILKYRIQYVKTVLLSILFEKQSQRRSRQLRLSQGEVITCHLYQLLSVMCPKKWAVIIESLLTFFNSVLWIRRFDFLHVFLSILNFFLFSISRSLMKLPSKKKRSALSQQKKIKFKQGFTK